MPDCSIAVPSPELLTSLSDDHCGRWMAVADALPPVRLGVLVMVRGDDCPAYGWLKFAAGDETCPYFVVPQRAAIGPRGCGRGKPSHAKNRDDVTHWWAPSPNGLPCPPIAFEDAAWGLGGTPSGWIRIDKSEAGPRLNSQTIVTSPNAGS